MIYRRGLPGEWLMVGVSGLLAMAALTLRGGAIPEAGDQAEIELTVVPMDEVQLACAGGVGQAICAFDAEGVPRSAATSPLMPFLTTWSQLVVMSGVFESPRVKTWLDHARGTGVRVKLRCPATVITPEAQIKLRFRTTDAFGLHSVAVLTAHDCELMP